MQEHALSHIKNEQYIKIPISLKSLSRKGKIQNPFFACSEAELETELALELTWQGSFYSRARCSPSTAESHISRSFCPTTCDPAEGWFWCKKSPTFASSSSTCLHANNAAVAGQQRECAAAVWALPSAFGMC